MWLPFRSTRAHQVCSNQLMGKLWNLQYTDGTWQKKLNKSKARTLIQFLRCCWCAVTLWRPKLKGWIVPRSCKRSFCFVTASLAPGRSASCKTSCNEGAGSGMHHTALWRACTWLGGITMFDLIYSYITSMLYNAPSGDIYHSQIANLYGNLPPRKHTQGCGLHRRSIIDIRINTSPAPLASGILHYNFFFAADVKIAAP